MKKEIFKIQLEGIFIRLAFIALGIVLNFKEPDNVFLWSIFILSYVIITLIQGLSKLRFIRIIAYFSILFISIYFCSVNLEVGIIGVICLIGEFTIEVKYLSQIFILIMIIFSMGINNPREGIVYFIVTVLNIFVLKGYSKYRKIIGTKSASEEYLKDDLYQSKNRNFKYKELSNQRVRIAKLEERNKIGREMHDRIGHVLAGSIMRLEAAKIILNEDREKGICMIDESIINLREGMNDIRGIVHKITPERDEVGIEKIKEEMLKKFKDTEIKVHIITEGDLKKVSSSHWRIFENACRELSTNMMKYSNGKNVRINISVFNKITTLSFSDDGNGSEKVKKGFGLRKIEDEVILQKGTLVINSFDGFQVIITLKIEE
ncbi:MAG: sensor histidine kinase [Clostridium sp.]